MASAPASGAVLLAALALCAPPAHAADGEFTYARAYAPGEVRHYDLERAIYRDGAPIYRATGISHHGVGDPKNGESIRIDTLIKYADEEPIDLSKDAAAVPALSLSIAAGAEDAAGVALPAMKGVDPALASLFADVRAVYLAVSPFAGIGHLRRMGDSFTRTEPVSLTRADTAPVSTSDCLRLKVELLSLSPSKATIRATFSAPAESCLPARKPWMEKPLDPDGAPNDFLLVARAGSSYRVFWGKETALVDATLDPKTGVLLAAQFEDVRLVKERSGCDAALDHCSPETESVMRRTLTLKAR